MTETRTATDPRGQSATQTSEVTIEAASGASGIGALFACPTEAEIARAAAEMVSAGG